MLSVFIEDTIGQKANALVPHSYTLAAFAASLGAIMADAGFGTPNVTEFTFSSPTAASPLTPAAVALWKSDPTGVVGKGSAIGHGLGLRHALRFDVSSGQYTRATRIGTMTFVFTDSTGHAQAQRFGPVHKDVLKKFFL